MMVEEIAAAAGSARWNTYAAWTQMCADRARLKNDIATHAAPAIVAADRVGMDTSRQEFTRRRNTGLDLVA